MWPYVGPVATMARGAAASGIRLSSGVGAGGRNPLVGEDAPSRPGSGVRLLHRDPTTGTLKLRLETPSDLWRIARLVRPGEMVGASTTRRDPEAPQEVPGAERTRRRIYLVVRAEQVEFHGFSKHVRITGPIVEGPFDLGRHHTLDLAEGDDVTLAKPELTAAERALLDEGLEGRGEPAIVVAAVDWGDSSVVRLRGRAVEPIADVRRTIAGKRFESGQGEKDRLAYVEELRGVIAREAGAASAIVLAGPGFLKEALARRLTESDAALGRRLRVYPASEGGRVGVDELLRSGRASEVLRASVAAEEAEVVERLVRALGGGRRAAVGRREVGEALEAGAVETVLVNETLLAEPEVVRLLDRSRSSRARLFVVRADDPPGRRLHGLGDIAAILRYDWTSAGGPTGPPGPPRAAPRSGGGGP
jgi:protein pelota